MYSLDNLSGKTHFFSNGTGQHTYFFLVSRGIGITLFQHGGQALHGLQQHITELLFRRVAGPYMFPFPQTPQDKVRQASKGFRRFHQIIQSPGFNGFYRQLLVAVAGHHNDRIGRMLLIRRKQLNSPAIRKQPITNYDIGFPLLHVDAGLHQVAAES